MKTITSNDSKYNKLNGKCVSRADNSIHGAYHIDAEGYMCYKNHIYVPNRLSIKQTIFKEFHDNPCARHPGYQKFTSALNKDFY